MTIDSSPPHTGSVQDGQRGHPEIDYQDSMQLHAHWEGFFDRESGVTFYQYGYAGHCLEIRNFGLDLPSPNVSMELIVCPMLNRGTFMITMKYN